MASQCRYVSGDAKPRVYKASQSYPFEKGDLLYEHPADHTLRRSSDMNAQGDEEHGQLGFAEYFVGVAGVKNGLESGEVSFKLNQNYEAEVLIFTGGVWEFDCVSQQFVSGQGVAIFSDWDGSCPYPQKVDALAGSAALEQRIGVAVMSAGALKAAAAMTRVQIEIQPKAFWQGGIPTAGTYTGTSGQ
jgi:hypothetical protein